MTTNDLNKILSPHFTVTESTTEDIVTITIVEKSTDNLVYWKEEVKDLNGEPLVNRVIQDLVQIGVGTLLHNEDVFFNTDIEEDEINLN